MLFRSQPRVPAVSAALAVYMAGWLFLSGGILDRYGRQRRLGSAAFFSACGSYFWRFVRLGVIVGVAYWFLFTYVHTWLFTNWYGGVNADLAVERTAVAWRFSMYALFGFWLVVINVIADYAKVRMVVEDRRSAIGAVVAALGFIRRNLGRVVGLYIANGLLFLVVIGVWALVAPGAGGAGASMWLGFVAGQVYLVARLMVKLQFMASQTALFQRSLAHASYVAAPLPKWPESPSVEAVSRV